MPTPAPESFSIGGSIAVAVETATEFITDVIVDVTDLIFGGSRRRLQDQEVTSVTVELTSQECTCPTTDPCDCYSFVISGEATNADQAQEDIASSIESGQFTEMVQANGL